MESSTKFRKMLYWLLSAIAATIVGYFVLQLFEKKPNIDSILSISDAGEKGYK